MAAAGSHRCKAPARIAAAGGPMTDQLTGIELPRPAPAAEPGPLDARLSTSSRRVRLLLVDNPILATYLGIHTGPGSVTRA
jgi:hypothetical protein